MWHLALEDAPTGTAAEIAWDLHTWPAGQDYPWRRPWGGVPVAPEAQGLSLAATLQRHPDKTARHFLQTGTVPAAPPDSEWRWDAGEAQPLPDPWVLPLWYWPMGTLAHATQAAKGAFPQPLLPGVALLRSLQAGAALVRWREGGGHSSPHFPLVQGQALLHAEGMGTVEWRAIVPDTACRWITAASPQPMRSPPACHRLLQMVPSLAPQHALTRGVWRAILSYTREWLTNPGARYPPGPLLEQLTAPTPGVRHALHRAWALTEQLNDEVLDLALEPLRVLYPQTHIPPAGTSNRLGRLGLQRRVEAAHPGGVVEQCLTLRNPSAAQGHWYIHQLLFLPRAAPEHRRQNPYHTHRERRGAQCFLQPVLQALSLGQGPEALQQAPPNDTATTVQQRGSHGADGAEPDCTNCGAVASTAACRHLAEIPRGSGSTDQRTAQRWRPRSRPSPWVPWRRARHNCCPRSPAATRSPASRPQRTGRRHPSRRSSYTSSRRRCWRTAGRASSTTTARRRLREAYKGRRAMHPTSGTPHSAGAPASGMRAAAHPLLGLSRGRHWCCRRQATRPSCTATLEGTDGTSWPGAAGLSGTAPPGKGHFRPCPTSTGSRGLPRPSICQRTLAAGGPATHRQRPQKEAGTGMGQPPRTGVEPRPGGASTGRVAGRRHQGHGRHGPPHGANHARPPGSYPGGGPTGDSRTHSGWSACSARQTRTSSSATPSACRGPKPWSAWQTIPA